LVLTTRRYMINEGDFIKKIEPLTIQTLIMLRKNLLFLVVIVLVAASCKKNSGPTSKTLTLQPIDNPSEMTVSELNGQDASSTGGPSIDVDEWTSSGEPWTLRGLIQFDLSSIPANAIIDSAYLYLYSDSTPISGNEVDANYGLNSFTIQQVAVAWTASSTSWSNQPSADTANQVIVPTTGQAFLNLKENVTAIVASMVKNNDNYGFLLELQSEVAYASRIFISSHNTTYPDGHPKLVVGYHQ
jgi:hypothetical protein